VFALVLQVGQLTSGSDIKLSSDGKIIADSEEGPSTALKIAVERRALRSAALAQKRHSRF